MNKILYTINTVSNFMDIIYNPFGVPFALANSDIEVYHIMDSSLLTDTRKYGKMIRPMLNIPIINIEEPVAEQAAAIGKRIGVIGTIPTSPGAISWEIEEQAAKRGKEIEIIPVVVDGAFDVLQAGNREKHDEMVCDALYKLAKDVDCVVFAQISMSRLKHEPVDVPLLKIGTSGFEKIRALID